MIVTSDDMEKAASGIPNLEELRKAPAALSASERLALFTHIFTFRPKNYLEVGTLLGGSALIVAHAMNESGNDEGRLVLVDPCTACEIDEVVWSKIERRSIRICNFSQNVLPSLLPGFDCIFIDGDHSEASAFSDLTAAWRILSADGSILIHDVNNMNVRSAVERFLVKHEDASDCGLLSHTGHEQYGEQWGGLQLIRKTRRIGIGIITMNRIEALKGCIAAIKLNTKIPYSLVVADDGSTDGSWEFLEKEGVIRLGGVNRGLGWNRNRVMHYFMEKMPECDTLIILEDDCHPSSPRWEREWIAAANKWSYVCYTPERLRENPACGVGTPADPWFCSWAGTQCVAVTRNAIIAVGYSDTRFHPPYGHEDTDLRWRYAKYMMCLKYGNCTPVLASGITIFDYGTFFNAESEKKNRDVLESVKNDPVYRPAWKNDEEMKILKDEIERAK